MAPTSTSPTGSNDDAASGSVGTSSVPFLGSLSVRSSVVSDSGAVIVAGVRKFSVGGRLASDSLNFELLPPVDVEEDRPRVLRISVNLVSSSALICGASNPWSAMKRDSCSTLADSKSTATRNESLVKSQLHTTAQMRPSK